MDARNTLIAVGLAALAACAGCSLTQKDPSVVYHFSNDADVVSGIAFDQGTLPEGDWELIVVPEGTRIVRTDEALRFGCVMKKEIVSAAGSPKESGLDKIRKKMGCAVLREGRATLRVGTFGDAAKTGEGRRATTLTLYLPRTTKVEFVNTQNNVACKGVLTAGVSMNAVPHEWTALLDAPAPEEAAFHRAEGDAKETK